MSIETITAEFGIPEENLATILFHFVINENGKIIDVTVDGKPQGQEFASKLLSLIYSNPEDQH